MGSLWLVNLPDWIDEAGLAYRTYKGWENRARSSGGYDAVYAIGYHHDATSPSSSPTSAEAYMWENADSRPIGALYIRRDGSVTIGAAGATNTMGKGGPITTSQGVVPLDRGNQYMVAIEAANNGIGEVWSSGMLDTYFALCATLCEHLDLGPNDCYSHWEYCQPSCPGRKIDPAGPTPSYPEVGGKTTCVTWSTTGFREQVAAAMNVPAPPSTAKEVTIMSTFNILAKASADGSGMGKGSFWAGNGAVRIWVNGSDFANNIIKASDCVDAKDGSSVSDWDQVTAISPAEINRLLGPTRVN